MRSGEVVGSGTPVLSMYVPTEAWVALAVREDKLPLFETGSTVEGTVPALGGEKIAFKVASKSALADFATWRASGAKGEFDLRSFGPVRKARQVGSSGISGGAGLRRRP